MDKKVCPRDCKLCTMPQQAYCASQMSLSTMDMVKAISDRLDAFMVQFQPESFVEPKAQEGEAVQTIDSPNKKKSYE